MRTSRVKRVGALLVGLTLVAAACGSDDSADEGAATSDATETTDGDMTETTDGDMTETTDGGGTAEAECGSAPSDVTGGDLAGFGATTPFGEITDEFISRLCSIDPNLEDLNYATETYDAIMITALAVLQAGTDGIEHAAEINGITRDGEKCTTFADCAALIEAGTDIDYDGVSGPLTFAGNGEPIVASYAKLVIGDNNRVDIDQTEYITAEGPPELDVEQTPVEGAREGDGVLTIGSILPQTGTLAFLGPPEFAGFNLAIQEINENGGVLGQDVVGIEGDSGDTSSDQANQTVDRLLSEDVDVIIGAASSSSTLTVIDKITAAGVTMFSPANTSEALSTYEDKGLYFRTAPPDLYQGDIIGQFITNDGNRTVAILNLNDAYGNGLADGVAATVTESGGEVVLQQSYDPQATSFDSEVDAMVAADPDAIVVIGFNESSKILRAMVEKGIGPLDKAVYGCDGNAGNAVGVDFDAGN
ncbi:MAG TPA: ABC transporter substrate-binding protein [Ilumatobacteraceae bacterium]|nr:ABC transporter substrate-binding protein [Ilumatobacteraceae bacterium]